MQLELQLSNECRVLSSVRAFARETLRQVPLKPAEAEAFEGLIVGAVEDSVLHAYRAGEEGTIRLSINDAHGRLEILVRDYGMPQDVGQLERRLHEPNGAPDRLFGCPLSLIDEVHWLAYGPEGKALQVRKWLHDQHVADNADAAEMTLFEQDAPLAPPQQYTVRRMTPSEAVQVSQLMYRTYGNTYFNPDVYYPERVAAHNANGSVISFVAVTDDGYVAGHYALELNQPGKVAEAGQAAVDPAHRGRGLMGRMKELGLEEARHRQLIGWYADAVTVHKLTQKSNADHDGRLTGADLGIAPKTEHFRGFAEQTQRVTCMLYFHWLTPPKSRTIYVPQRYEEIVSKIYSRLECPFSLEVGATPTGHGTLAVKADPAGGVAFVRASQLGADTVHSIRQVKRELVERSAAAAVIVELPLGDPGTPDVMEQLEASGFGFTGIAPHFAAEGDLIRIVYLVDALLREPIQTYDDAAAELVDYALREQNRVQASM